MQLALTESDDFYRFNHGARYDAYVAALRRELQAVEQAFREANSQPTSPTRRPPARRRQARRPRAQASRSSEASGDSPDDSSDGSDEPARSPGLRRHARYGPVSRSLYRLLLEIAGGVA